MLGAKFLNKKCVCVCVCARVRACFKTSEVWQPQQSNSELPHMKQNFEKFLTNSCTSEVLSLPHVFALAF